MQNFKNKNSEAEVDKSYEDQVLKSPERLFDSMEDIENFIKEYPMHQLSFRGARTLVFNCQGAKVDEAEQMVITKAKKCNSQIFIGFLKQTKNFNLKRITKHSCKHFSSKGSNTSVFKENFEFNIKKQSKKRTQKEKEILYNKLGFKGECSILNVVKEFKGKYEYQLVYESIVWGFKNEFKIDGMISISNLFSEEKILIGLKDFDETEVDNNILESSFYTEYGLSNTNIKNSTGFKDNLGGVFPTSEFAKIFSKIKLLDNASHNIDYTIRYSDFENIMNNLYNLKDSYRVVSIVLKDLNDNFVSDFNSLYSETYLYNFKKIKNNYAKNYKNGFSIFFDYNLGLQNSRPVCFFYLRKKLIESSKMIEFSMYSTININGTENTIAVGFFKIENTNPINLCEISDYFKKFVIFVEKGIENCKIDENNNKKFGNKNLIVDPFFSKKKIIVVVEYDPLILMSIKKLENEIDFFVSQRTIIKHLNSLNTEFDKIKEVFNDLFNRKNYDQFIIDKLGISLPYIYSEVNDKRLKAENYLFSMFVENKGLSQCEAFLLDSFNYSLQFNVHNFNVEISAYEEIQNVLIELSKNSKFIHESNIKVESIFSKYCNYAKIETPISNKISCIIEKLQEELQEIKNFVVPTIFAYYSNILYSHIPSFDFIDVSERMHTNEMELINHQGNVNSFLDDQETLPLGFFELCKKNKNGNYACNCGKKIYKSLEVNEKLFVCEHVLIFSKYKGMSLLDLIDESFLRTNKLNDGIEKGVFRGETRKAGRPKKRFQ